MMDLCQIVNLSSVVDATPALERSYWVQTLKAGLFSHWLYGDIPMDEDRFRRFAENYGKNIYGQDLHINFEHGMDAAKGMQAAGWVKDVKFDANSMSWLIEFTADAVAEIQDKKWRYFSAEFTDKWTSEYGVTYNDVITGGALTNQPFLKGMQPLNFSDLFNAPTAEHVPEEHSEPGTGNPPLPRETPAEADQEGGWRRDTPPIVKETEDREEVSIMDRAQLVLFAQKLGIEVTDDMSDEDLVTKLNEGVDTVVAEVAPLREAAAAAETSKTFREQFPDEFQRMQKFESESRENKAIAFSESYRVITDSDGKPTGKGFSTVVVDKLKGLHLKLSEGSVTHDDLKDLVDAIGTGVVKLNEDGSSTPTDVTVKKFSELAKEVQAQDENVGKSWNEVVKLAARKYPTEYEAYLKNPSAN